jgi:methylated-DNA-[protein]-cysteine S-methyltransferase
MIIVSDLEENLRAIDWTDHEERMHQLLRVQYGGVELRFGPATTSNRIVGAIEAYFHGELTAIDALPVKTGGTPFQRDVWRALRTIPCGTTISYAQLADRLGRRNAIRAVGSANARNPVGVVVPCHRVIGSDGSLTGYGGGMERKKWLLKHEAGLN